MRPAILISGSFLVAGRLQIRVVFIGYMYVPAVLRGNMHPKHINRRTFTNLLAGSADTRRQRVPSIPVG